MTEQVVEECVYLSVHHLFVLDLELLLADGVDFDEEVWLPAEELDCLDVVEALVYEGTALFHTSLLLLSKFSLALCLCNLDKRAEPRLEENNEAAPSN